MPGLYNLKKGNADDTDVKGTAVLAAADGAIVVQSSTVFITKGSAAALTLAAPTTGQDGVALRIVSTTAFAHTVTQTTPGFNNAGAAGDVATFAAAAGNAFLIVAYAGKWYTVNLQGVTLA
jgi:hypothetical protein